MRHGLIENKILSLLKFKPMKACELIIGVYGTSTQSKEVSLRGTLKKLISKGMIKKVERTYHFIKDFEVIGKVIRTGTNGRTVTIPKINKTEDWKFGDKVKLEKLE